MGDDPVLDIRWSLAYMHLTNGWDAMTLASQIRVVAAEIVANAQQRASSLQREFEEIEAHQLEIKAKLNALNLAHDRLLNFVLKIGPDYQCPRCWIEHEK